MEKLTIDISPNQFIYFASDFHLGAPNAHESREREIRIVSWLNDIEANTAAIFLVGDIFDFWFEYKHVIPRGFSRFQGKLRDLRDKGIPIFFFRGNHDMWMFDYFQEEFDIPVFHDLVALSASDKKFLIGHGDGLGPGDHTYKIIKRVFRNGFAQWAFQWLHPNIGVYLAKKWSSKSRIKNNGKDDSFKEDDEWLLKYCSETEEQDHHDYYVFGHRHLPIEIDVNESSKYINLGEWFNQYTYGVFDGDSFDLKSFEI